MKFWKVSPKDKKCIVEYQSWIKNDDKIMVETSWRHGEFMITTENDEKPNYEIGSDIFMCGDESELVNVYDNCGDIVHYDWCSEESQEEIKVFLSEENSIGMLGDLGWDCCEHSFCINCEVEIEPCSDDEF